MWAQLLDDKYRVIPSFHSRFCFLPRSIVGTTRAYRAPSRCQLSKPGLYLCKSLSPQCAVGRLCFFTRIAGCVPDFILGWQNHRSIPHSHRTRRGPSSTALTVEVRQVGKLKKRLASALWLSDGEKGCQKKAPSVAKMICLMMISW